MMKVLTTTSPLDEQEQLQGMAEVQRLLDFPPAPKLDVNGHLDPALATDAELRGEQKSDLLAFLYTL